MRVIVLGGMMLRIMQMLRMMLMVLLVRFVSMMFGFAPGIWLCIGLARPFLQEKNDVDKLKDAESIKDEKSDEPPNLTKLC
jgi:hypothetical protein